MSRATWLADVLRDAGLVVKPYSGWETRGANDFTPLGVMWHHTVTSPSTPDSSVDRTLATGGNANTPPPLCNYSTNRDGTVSIIAAGTANHAGAGAWNGITAVSGVNGDDGNERFFGDEMKNNGTTEAWPRAQLESARIAAAAILNHLGADASWLCSHKEWAPGRKVDPHSLNMSTERGLVDAIMEDDMPTPEEIAQAVWSYPSQIDDGQGGKIHMQLAVSRGTNNAVASYNILVAGQGDIDAIVEAIDELPADVADEIARRLQSRIN